MKNNINNNSSSSNNINNNFKNNNKKFSKSSFKVSKTKTIYKIKFKIFHKVINLSNLLKIKMNFMTTNMKKIAKIKTKAKSLIVTIFNNKITIIIVNNSKTKKIKDLLSINRHKII